MKSKTLSLSQVFLLVCATVFAMPVEGNTAALKCLDEAGFRNLTMSQKLLLCRGAVSNAPLQCFDEAQFRGLTINQKIALCRKSKDSADTLACFDNSQFRGLTIENRLILCRM